MYQQDLALNNLQWLICHMTKPNNCIKGCITKFQTLMRLSPFAMDE